MKKISKYKVDKSLLITLLLFVAISIVTIYSAQNMLHSGSDLALRQGIWYLYWFYTSIFDNVYRK